MRKICKNNDIWKSFHLSKIWTKVLIQIFLKNNIRFFLSRFCLTTCFKLKKGAAPECGGLAVSWLERSHRANNVGGVLSIQYVADSPPKSLQCFTYYDTENKFSSHVKHSRILLARTVCPFFIQFVGCRFNRQVQLNHCKNKNGVQKVMQESANYALVIL